MNDRIRLAIMNYLEYLLLHPKCLQQINTYQPVSFPPQASTWTPFLWLPQEHWCGLLNYMLRKCHDYIRSVKGPSDLYFVIHNKRVSNRQCDLCDQKLVPLKVYRPCGHLICCDPENTIICPRCDTCVEGKFYLNSNLIPDADLDRLVMLTEKYLK